MPAITSQNVALAITKLVASDALPALVGNLVMGNLVNRNYESKLAQFGDTINVPIPPSLAANDIGEAGSVQAQAASLGNAQIILNRHKESTFVIPDVTQVFAQPNLLNMYMQPAINALAEAIETDLLALYPNFTANTAVGGSSTVDEARIDAAETALFNQKVPQNLAKYLVVSANTYSGLRSNTRFTEYQTSVNRDQASPVQTGQLAGNGMLKGFQVFRSQFVAKPSTTTYNVAFARDAIALVVRRLPEPLPGTGAIATFVEQGGFGMRVTMSYQPNTLAQQFTVDVLYGCGVLRNSFGLQVQTN